MSSRSPQPYKTRSRRQRRRREWNEKQQSRTSSPAVVDRRRRRRLVRQQRQRRARRGARRRQGRQGRPAAGRRQRGGAAAPGRAGRPAGQRHRDADPHRRPAPADHQHHPRRCTSRKASSSRPAAAVLARRPRRPRQPRQGPGPGERDRATLADLERQYKRSQDLVAQNFIAKSAVDTLRPRSTRRAPRCRPTSPPRAPRSVSASYTAIRAPMAGRVGAINVYPGSLVQPATSLTTVTQLDPITVAFTVPEGQPAGPAGGAAARQGRRSQAMPGADRRRCSGTLSFVDNTVDPQPARSGQGRVRQPRHRRCGRASTSNTQVTVRTLKDAVVVPAAPSSPCPGHLRLRARQGPHGAPAPVQRLYASARCRRQRPEPAASRWSPRASRTCARAARCALEPARDRPATAASVAGTSPDKG